MVLVLIAWMYVTLMMAVAEATSSQGTVLGAIITFLLYGVAPASLAMYLLHTPARRKALRKREALEALEAGRLGRSVEPDAGGHAAAAAEGEVVAPVRKEP
jgi:membrane protein implicated in regulation of membrane protease activity